MAPLTASPLSGVPLTLPADPGVASKRLASTLIFDFISVINGF